MFKKRRYSCSWPQQDDAKLKRCERGQGLVEYGLIIALISAVVVGSMNDVGGRVRDNFTGVIDKGFVVEHPDDSDDQPDRSGHFVVKDGVIKGLTPEGKGSIVEGELVIPAAINGVRVRGIAPRAFYIGEMSENPLLNSIVVPEGIEFIGEEAFYGNTLTSVSLPDSLSMLGSGAFQNNNISEIKIPKGLDRISDYTFYGNQLTTVHIHDNITHLGEWSFGRNRINDLSIPTSVVGIGSGAFNDNILSEVDANIFARTSNGSEDKSTIVSYGGKSVNVSVPKGVKVIAPYAYYTTRDGHPSSIQTVNIAEGVELIGEQAFSRQQIRSVTIPKSVKVIGDGAFRATPITEVIFKGNVEDIGKDVFFRGGTPGYDILSSHTIGTWKRETTYRGWKKQVDHNVPVEHFNFDTSSGTIIGFVKEKRGLYYDVGLQLTIPKMIDGVPVKSIRYNAFGGLGLASVQLPDGLEVIGRSAFQSNKISKLNLPNTIRIIDNDAFGYNNFFEVYIPNSVELVGERSFSGQGGGYSDSLPTNIPTGGWSGTWKVIDRVWKKQ